MFERFTRDARLVVAGAQGQARRLGQRYVGTEHLLLGLLDPDSGGTVAALLQERGLTVGGVREAIARAVSGAAIDDGDAAALQSIGIDVQAVRARIEESFGPGAWQPAAAEPRRRWGGYPLTPRAKKVLELSLREAVRLRHNTIGTEHLLLGLIREGQGLAAKIVAEAGVDLPGLRLAVENSLRPAA